MAKDLYEKAKARLARERGGVAINRAAPVRFALAFPNVYRVGMASLGFHIVYQMLNALPNASCERVFLPDPGDLREHLRIGTELFTLESRSPLSEFDVIGISVSFEPDYLNVLQMLDLAGIPIERAARDEAHPLVIAGGTCAAFNPEPLADFVDACVVGDAEEVLGALADAIERGRGRPRRETLAALAEIPGVYVPDFYSPIYDRAGRFVGLDVTPPAPPRVRRAVTSDLAKYPARSAIRAAEAEFGEIELVEVARGCGRRCRFCVTGHITGPPRARLAHTPLPDSGRGWGRGPDAASGPVRLGLVGAAVFDHPGSEQLCESILASGGRFTVSSVRLETVTPHIAQLMAAGGQKTLTIAPEAGSDRLRRVINKAASEDDIHAAVAAASGAGIPRLKLYFMIGLPTETDDDIDAIPRLVRRLALRFPKIAFQVSASCFVPKPWTPFQWHPMEAESTLKRRFAALKKGISSIGGVEFSGESPRLSMVQGLLARGDRRTGRLLVATLMNGGDWLAALRETGLDPAGYLYRPRSLDEPLPWDHTDARIEKWCLWDEYQKALGCFEVAS